MKGEGKPTKDPQVFIEKIPEGQLAKFNDSTKIRRIFPAANDVKSNFRLDMQGTARENTCFNLQVQINKAGTSSSWRKAATAMKTTLATCIATPKATVTEVRQALLDSLAANGEVKTAGEVPAAKKK